MGQEVSDPTFVLYIDTNIFVFFFTEKTPGHTLKFNWDKEMLIGVNKQPEKNLP